MGRPLLNCDSCGKEYGAEISTGGMSLICHECAHKMGLGHKHDDMDITDTIHHHTDFKPEGLPDHLKAYRELHPIRG